jgi:5S rRNA maturation endonuclease (ribonuclease M5)
LAKENNIPLPRETNPVQQVFTLAAAYYHQGLLEGSDRPQPLLGGKTPSQYQTEHRKRKAESLSKYKIGYSDGGLTDYLDAVGISVELAVESGLVKQKKKDGKLVPGQYHDFLPSNCFIYPHYVKGRASHFTFKDPTKRLAYQLPKKCSLNHYTFYGQDTFSASEFLMLVEGENDWLAVMESGKSPATFAIIGQISGEQLEWLKNHCGEKKIITMFDPDDAGDKYRIKVELLRKHFKGLVHVKPPEDKDIDELLIGGADLEAIVRGNMVKVDTTKQVAPEAMAAIWDEVVEPLKPVAKPSAAEVEASVATAEELPYKAILEASVSSVEAVEAKDHSVALIDGQEADVVAAKPSLGSYVPPNIPSEQDADRDGTTEDGDTSLELIQLDDSPVIQRRGQYEKIESKDGIEKFKRISDFTIKLLNVYVKEDGDREREIIVTKANGLKSDPILVNSETKVTPKDFKRLMAKAVDGEWLGQAWDLDAMWRLVYNQARDTEIRVPQQVGRHERHNCWIFNNVLITGSGVGIRPDENGVFWTVGKTRGIKPDGLNVDKEAVSSLPSLEMSLSREESDELLKGALHHYAKNLDSIGDALLAFGWIYSNIYSDRIYKLNGGMSILLLWSLFGEGKTTLVEWLRYFFGFLDKTGRTTPTMMGSGIGFLRQGEYYSSMPLFIDELRQDEESKACLGRIRSWYDRDGRTLATRETHGIRIQKLRSTLIVAGEDLPADPATRERCVSIRVKKKPETGSTEALEGKGRETVESFAWFQKNGTSLSNVMYYWIIDAVQEDNNVLVKGMAEIDKALRASGCSSRTSKNWSAAGYLGQRLADKFYPNFDFKAYMAQACVTEHKQQREDTSLQQFFEIMEAMMAQEDSRINDAHIQYNAVDNTLYIWFAAVFKEVFDEMRGKLPWSKNAILRALREEKYFVRDDQKITMGIGIEGAKRNVITLSMKNCPDVLHNIAKTNM